MERLGRTLTPAELQTLGAMAAQARPPSNAEQQLQLLGATQAPREPQILGAQGGILQKLQQLLAQLRGPQPTPDGGSGAGMGIRG